MRIKTPIHFKLFPTKIIILGKAGTFSYSFYEASMLKSPSRILVS